MFSVGSSLDLLQKKILLMALFVLISDANSDCKIIKAA